MLNSECVDYGEKTNRRENEEVVKVIYNKFIIGPG